MVKNYVKLILAFVFATNLMAQNVPKYVPTNGLVGWWPFNGNANDESGNGNHGTVNGATLTADRNGKSNSAYSFDGINNWIRIEDNPTLRPGYITLSTWVYAKNNSANPIITKTRILDPSGPDGGEQYVLFYSDFNTQNTAGSFQIKRNGGCVNGGAGWHRITQNKLIFETSAWHHITATYDGLVMKLYIDAKLSGTFNPPAGLIDNCTNGTFNIGRSWPNNSSFNGLIDDIAVYNRALTQEEITALYTSTPPCTTPSAVITPQGNTTFCQGGFVNLNASTGVNYTYDWYNNGQLINGANSSVYQAITSGNYTVKVIDGACNATSAATMVTVNPLPNVTLNALNQFTLKNAIPIQLVASPSGGIFSGDGIQGATFTPANVSLGKKTITYNYTSPQGCSGKASSYTIIADTLGNICFTYDTLKVKLKLTTGIKANQYTTMNVYPNPTSDVIIIESSDVAALNGYSYKLVDIQGKEVYNALVTNVKTEISLKPLVKQELTSYML